MSKQTPHPRRAIDWSAVDWNLQNCEIARLLGVAASWVGDMRKKLKKKNPRNWHLHTGPRGRSKWNAVDWRKQNGIIAEEMGLSFERVRQVRKLLGAPKPAIPYRHRSTDKVLAKIVANQEQFKGLDLSKAAK